MVFCIQDRCHRMGQKKPVSVYRLVTEGSIEEGMLMVAQEKLNLEKEVTEKGVEQEHKCMVRLLTMALGMKDDAKAAHMLSPQKPNIKEANANGHDDLEF